ncbi:MAG: DUF3962 domain-containing protein, partial [Ruminococcus sp.]|nr:DUF3962 domain-containing protein [Ruminococcus sp.]
MSAPIYPMALKPRTNTIFKLYYVAFPAAWKELIIKLDLSVVPRFDLNYNLKTNVLYGYLNGWLDDVVMLRPLRQDSDDEKWLVSINEPDLEKICEILQIWISSEYLCDQRATDETKELGEKLIDIINAEELGEGMTSEEALLFDADGHALTDHAFNAFALYAANTLCGKTIELRGNKLRLSNCGARELICQPLSDGKENPHYYAFKLGLSLQTTPPERECMLLINTSVSRFISDVWKDNIYLKEKIRAYVLTGESKYKRMTISQFTKKTEDKKKEYHQYWNKAERNCYDLYSMTPLPDAEELLRAPRSYVEEPAEPRILLPYKNGMDFANMRVGVGVPVTDKYEISRNISELISDIAEPLESAEPVSKGKIVHYKKPDNEDERQENHINRLKSCTGKSELTIEIYGHDNDKLLQNMI